MLNKVLYFSTKRNMCIKPLLWLITVLSMNKIQIHLWLLLLQTYIYKIMDINDTFWHRANVYFMWFKYLLWLVTISHMNPFFFWDSTTNIKFKKNIALITCIEPNVFYMSQQHMTSDYCTKYEWNQLIIENKKIPHQIHKMYEKVTIISQSWHRAKWYFTSTSNACTW